jgi:DNA repair exonuclease SbcCD ATPase subunit
MRAIGSATVEGNFEAANTAIQKRLEELRKIKAESNSITGTIGNRLNSIFGSGPDPVKVAEEQNRELARLQKQLAENIAATSKTVREKANDEQLADDLDTIDRVNKAYEEAIKERAAAEKKASEDDQNFAEQQFRDYEQWLSKKTALEDKARKDKEAKDREADERAKQVAEENFKQFEELQKRKSQLEQVTAERNKQYRENIIAEELKPAGQRNAERVQAGADARAELRAINRLAQKAQDKQNSDWRNPRMTDAERNALADKLKQQRVEDTKPQMEKDISEINASIKAMKTKIGVA